MDKMGLRRQFLPAAIQPLDRSMVTIGRAMPVLEADCFEEGAKPFGVMLEALDDLKTNEVYVCAGASYRYALWGELMSIRAMKLGAVGAVMDGYSRDTRGILDLKFPTFSRGAYAQDQGPRGKVIDFRVPIEMEGGVRIEVGDIIFGDLDGVCVIPRKAEDDVFTAAIEKARGEKTVRKAIEEGMGAAEAFRTFGIM
ncbi:MAG: RraA family protein [Proteobacteria bacterium]|nr:RraA family protein [Pseudomonadota bacterium]